MASLGGSAPGVVDGILSDLNNLELWGADIGNGYLEAYTYEKLFIIAGAEFEELEGFIPVLNKALYGLKSCGESWTEKLHHIIKDMGFMLSKADPCVWMRENKKLKCYIATYHSEMLSKHWEIIEILPMIMKLLIPYDPITLILWSSTDETLKLSE